jgi:CRISPR/Cas system CSM-associated protein Csm3 (group 7 of RAMP superfamily)
MPRTLKVWPLVVQFETPLHHGSGLGMARLVDRCAVRDTQGCPYLAGSALKGKFRHAALRIELALGESACEFGDRPECPGDNPCALCRLFGSRVRRGQLVFTDAYPGERYGLLLDTETEQRRALFHSDALYRATTALDRVRGVAREGMLFTTEVLPAGIEFQGEIRGPAEYDTLLRQAANLLTHFGANGARGLGRCTYKFKEEHSGNADANLA